VTPALRLVRRPAAGEDEAGAVPAAATLPARVPTAEAEAKRAERGKRGRRMETLREVVVEVEALRPLLREVVEQYELRIAAQLAEVLRALHGESAAFAQPPSIRTTSAMLRAIRQVEIKPARGRAKDLVRLHELVAELTELLTPDA
jgi:hypothetical protein